MQTCIYNGSDFEQIMNYVETFKGTSQKVTANARSRMRKKIKEIYDLLIHKDFKIQAKLNHNNHVLEYLRFFGINT